MFLREIWQRVTTSQRTREREAAARRESTQREIALREKFARRTHELEAQIARAHVENCRLRAENRALLNSVLGIAGIPPVIVTDPPAAFIQGASADAPQSAGEPDLFFVGAQHAVPSADAWLDGAHTPARSSAETRHDAAHPASTLTAPEAVAASAQEQTRRGRRRPHSGKDQHAIVPIRRRSWHQIYRMLEFESSRRKEQDT